MNTFKKTVSEKGRQILKQKAQISFAFAMCEARLENSDNNNLHKIISDLENEIQRIANGEILYDESGLLIE